MQRRQIDVLLEVRRLAAEVLEHASQLLLLRKHVRRQQSAQMPSASRSASVNAVPLFSAGSCRRPMPLGSGTGRRASRRRSAACRSLHATPCVLSCPHAFARSGRLRNHLDRAARALGHADAAALAVVEIELEPLARPQLDHRVVGAHAVAVVALEAVAARQAAARLEQRVGLVEAAARPRRKSRSGARARASGAPSSGHRCNTTAFILSNVAISCFGAGA